ncbi:MAG: phosphatase PAP2 family protein [Actinomycetota bacterium]|nr:phosphatase PAP2 family protein [Actinomycetota bacterium]
MTRRVYGLAVALAVLMGGLSVAAAWWLDLPLRDPDGTFGPSWLRLPLIALGCFLADVVPRGIYRARGLRGSRAHFRAVVRERWTQARVSLIVVGLGSFYLTYVGYRNLKSFLPWIRDHTYDAQLAALDRVLAFGYEPATVLQDILGTGIAAHILSVFYVGYLVFVPVSLAAWLVWSRNMAGGLWYTTALCVNWTLGLASYYLIPSWGPAFANPALFRDLPDTSVRALQAELWAHRYEVLLDPNATQAVSSIAGFASLHVSVVFTAALITHMTVRNKWARWAMWAYLPVTVVATLYFGWHFIADDIAGLAIGLVAVWVGAWVTGHELRPKYRGLIFGSGEPEDLPPPRTPGNRELETLQTT